MAHEEFIRDFRGFWKRFFPEQETLNRSEALLQINDPIDGQPSRHWSKRWMRWIWEAARIAKDGGQMLFTCSTLAPRSNITPAAFVKEAKKYINIAHHGFLTGNAPRLIGGTLGVPTRYIVVGERKRR